MNNMDPTEGIDIYDNFEDMGLKDDILRGVYSYGFETPSEIQKRGIVKMIEGRDIIAQAQSGTGKTATFTIGMLESLDIESKSTQVLIMSHTRELSQQIYNVIKNISKYMKININLSAGGVSMSDNIESLRKNPHIIIGTPGRVLDMIHKKFIRVNSLKMLILDEADELLSHIFITQIYDIFQNLPPNIQVCLFSATMNESFFSITNKFMRDPVKILVKTNELTLEGIKQFYIDIEKNEFKYDTLCDIYANISITQSIIYCNSIKIVDIISNKLNNDNFSVACIHGNMNQQERNQVVKEFRDGKSRVLISTDLLSRGIDIQQISIVINYDVPKNIDNYIHRIGRSGRYGRKGVAINFVTNNDREQLRSIEQYYNTEIPELPNLEVLKI
jgi:superfamily II DNA/RNA helicase